MRIAILSDSHDNIWNLEKVLERVAGADRLIFCGDFCAPFSLALVAEKFPGPIDCVAGNNDGDAVLLERIARKSGHVTMHGQFADLKLDAWRAFVNHYPPIGEAVAASGLYDLVCFGHNHIAEMRQVGRTTLVNPGEVMGRLGHSTFATYDTETGRAELHEVQ
jgi:uncharacterized protein